MTKTLLRAGALSCALLATTALTAPALAQTGQTVPPEVRGVDANGVDMISGDFVLSFTEATIGSGEGALALTRNGVNAPGESDWQNMWLQQAVSGSDTTATVVLGESSETFTKSGSGDFTPALADGATLTGSVGSNYVYRDPEGTTITFGAPVGDQHGASPFCVHSNANPNGCRALALSLVRPNGARIDWDWDIRSHCVFPSPEAEYRDCTYAWRLEGVSNNFGYQIDFNFVTDSYSFSTGTPDFFVRSGASLSNSNVSGEDPLVVSYARPSAGVFDVTVPGPTSAGLTWRFTSGTGTFAIRRPGSSSDDVSIAYGSNGVTQVTRDGVTTGYAHSVFANTATTVITDALSRVTTVEASTVRGRVTSVTDALNRETLYGYDTHARLTAVVMPEGNSIAYTYDSHGNITETRAREKGDTSDTGDDIVTSATFPCASVVTCARPSTATDALGRVTNYSYDSTHGGVTAVTGPAPSGSGTRPETRYSYSQVTAVTGQPVYVLTGMSSCQTGSASSCVGTADEARTAISYDTINIRPTSIATGNGITSGAELITATVATTYTPYGDPLTVDGPLTGSDDTAYFRYDGARRRVGAISPDPDGSGSGHPLKRRAQRTTYRDDGQVIAIETGTVEGTSDSDWASMNVLQGVQTDYDGNHRPQFTRLVSGSTTYSLAQTGYDALGRVRCVAQRMNPSAFGTPLSDVCVPGTEGSYGPDRISRTSYDELGRAILVETGVGTSAEADEVATSYTANGRVATVTDAEGNKTTYEYDEFDRLRNTRFPSPTTDGVSAPTSGTGADYEQLSYDKNGNVTSRRLRDGSSIGFTFDNLNRLIATDMPNSGTNPFEPDIAYTYDLVGHMLSATDSNTNHATFTYDALGRVLSEASLYGTAWMQYDAAGRRTQLTYPGSSLYVDYVYDVVGEMTEIRENGATTGAGLLATFAYDDRGRRTLLSRGNGQTTSYSYDNVSRLTELAQNLGGTSNDLTLGFGYNPAAQIVSNTRSNDGYSFTGHINLNRADTINGLNQATQTGATGITHDSRGNITAIGAAEYTYNANNQLWYAYGNPPAPGRGLSHDPLGRLNATISNDWSDIDIFLYAGNNMIAEKDESGNMMRRYVYGPGVDEPLVWYEGSGTSDRRWLHADERGSIVAVSDGSGDLVGTRNRYDEYGMPQGTLTGRFGYAGRLWIPEAGLYDYRARMYNPGLGRFMQTDPIGFDGGMNIYAYVLNDPVNGADPFGLRISFEMTGTRIKPLNPYNGGCGSCSGSTFFGPSFTGEKTTRWTLIDQNTGTFFGYKYNIEPIDGGGGAFGSGVREPEAITA